MSTFDDTAGYFTPDMGAIEVEYTSVGGSGRLIWVHFLAAFSVTYVGGIPQQNKDPQAICMAVDVGDAIQGDTFLIEGTTYSVIEVQPGGEGVTTLILSKN